MRVGESESPEQLSLDYTLKSFHGDTRQPWTYWLSQKMLGMEDGQIKEGEITQDACEDRCGKVVQERAAHVVVIRGRDLPHKQPSVPQVYWQGSNINLWSVSQEGAYLSLDLVFRSWGPPPSPAPEGLLWQGGNCRRCDGLCGKEGSRGAFEIKDGKESAGSVPDNNPVFDRGYPLILLILLQVCLTQQAGLQIITHTFTIFTFCQIIKLFFITHRQNYVCHSSLQMADNIPSNNAPPNLTEHSSLHRAVGVVQVQEELLEEELQMRSEELRVVVSGQAG